MSHFHLNTISIGALIAASALVGTANVSAQTMKPAQPDNNPAHQMHFAQKNANGTTVTAGMSDPIVGGASMYPSKTIIENAVNSQDHTTLVAAVKAAGLVDTLSGPGPFTVFAPTNEAFDALPKGTVENLLKPENKATLTQILTCHVLAGKVSAAELVSSIGKNNGSYTLTTVGGCKLVATVSDGKVMLTDESGATGTVTIADVNQSNGVIHVVDKVLLPKM